MFDRLINKKMLKGMFDDSFEIDGGVRKISLDNYDEVSVGIIKKNLPTKVPKKWEREAYNAISFTLRFVFVEKFNLEGVLEKSEKDFSLFEKNDRVFISIARDDFKMCCKAEFFYVENISCYLDERWD